MLKIELLEICHLFNHLMSWDVLSSLHILHDAVHVIGSEVFNDDDFGPDIH